MKISTILLIWSLALVSFIISSCMDLDDPVDSTNDAKYKQGFVPRQVIVQGQMATVRQFFQSKNIMIKSVDRLETGADIFRLQLVVEKDINLPSLVEDLNELSDVQFAELNYVYTLNAFGFPKDAYVVKQWALKNLGQDSPSGSQGEAGADVGMIEAWKSTTGSKDIVVGVVDTGIDYTHPDLVDNMWVNEKERDGIAGVDDDGNGYTDDVFGWNFITAGLDSPYYGQLGRPDPMDDNVHGTHCAGIIGAKGNNYIGVAGVNWNVKLMALKFLDKAGSGSSWDAARAILYGVNNGTHVLSNSWGGGSKSNLIGHAIKIANEKGVLFVVAAGNSSSNNDDTDDFPSGYAIDNVFSVAASDNKDRIAQFSNYGMQKVHIAAPGVDILSTVPVYTVSDPKSAYASLSGTSMAAPYVSGAAALLLAHDSSFLNKPLAIKQRLMATVDILSSFSGLVVSQGRLNVARALSNQVNQVNDQNLVLTEDISIEAPRFNTELFDKVWLIKKSDALSMRIHFEWIIADVPGFDLLAVYDQDYQRIFNVDHLYPTGVWSPWVMGDTLYLRMANAVVAQTITEEKEFSSPDDGFKAGAVSCLTAEDGKTTCMIQSQTDSFANFESEGFKVDKIEFRMEGGGDTDEG